MTGLLLLILILWMIGPLVPAIVVLTLSALTLPFKVSAWAALSFVDFLCGGKRAEVKTDE